MQTPNQLPRQQRQRNIHSPRIHSRKDIIINQHLYRPAIPRHRPREIPQLLQRPTVSKIDQRRDPHKHIHGDDQPPNHLSQPSLRQSQNRQREARLGPDRRADGQRGRDGEDLENPREVLKRDVPAVLAEAHGDGDGDDDGLGKDGDPGGEKQPVVPPEDFADDGATVETEGEEEGGDACEGPDYDVELRAERVVRERGELLRG